MTVSLDSSPAVTSPDLAAAVDRRLLAPAASIGVELPFVGVSDVPRQPVLAYAGDRPWYFCDHIDDPTVRQFGGRVPVPEANHRHLVALQVVGVHADLIWLAHELPDGWREGEELPDLIPADVRPVVRPGTMTIGGQRQTIQVVRRMVEGTFGGLRAFSRSLENLDPIVLAGITDATGEQVAWAELTRWAW
jgi:hypothetical protein